MCFTVILSKKHNLTFAFQFSNFMKIIISNTSSKIPELMCPQYGYIVYTTIKYGIIFYHLSKIKNLQIDMFTKRPSPKRPQSSISYTSTSRRRQFRFNGNQELTNVTANIHQTFNRENRYWTEIKTLTNDKVDKKHQKTIDNLCVKYSILHDRKRNPWNNISVDVDFLVKNYIKSKSLREEKRKSRVNLRKQIRSITSRHEKKSNRSFFTMSRSNLLSICQKSKLKQNQSQNTHPYMIYYEQQQKQALISITEGHAPLLTLEKDFPPLIEAEQWQREHYKKKGIYMGVSTFRQKTSMARKKRYSQAQISNFFVTE